MLGLRLRVHRHVVVDTVRALRTQTRASRTTQSPKTSKSLPSAELKEKQQLARPGLYVGLAIACGLGLYCTSLVIAVRKANQNPDVLDVSKQKDVAGRYDEIADSFDSDVNISEWLMGILKLRKSIARSCVGDVLEVSCGTGRNLGYFQLDQTERKINSLTMLDLSPQMIQVCKRKFLALRAKSKTRQAADPLEVRFIAGSALDEMPLASSGKKYDTIIQTMGLCSTAAPVELVINMARHLDLSNPEARIFLLEHGRGSYQWLNNVIDSSAAKHADAYGCWYNRELTDIVQDAVERTGFEVVRLKRYDLGTTYLFELKAGPNAATRLNSLTDVTKNTPTAQSTWKKWFSRETEARSVA